MAIPEAATAPSDPTRAALAGVLDAGFGASYDMIAPARILVTVLAIGLPALLLVQRAALWPAALAVAAFFGGLAIAFARAPAKVRARSARVREAVLDHPDDVAEIAHRRGGDPRRPANYMTVSIVLRDDTAALMRVELEHLTRVLDLLTARCPRAVTHAGLPSKKLRGAPVARVVTR